MTTPSLIWITGASTGIGRAVALAYARQGSIVAASARDAKALETLSEESGGKIRAYPLDVTDRSANLRVVERIEADLGPIALTILNAGTHHEMTAANFDPAVFDKLFAVNFFGVVNGLAAVIPRFINRRAGHIAIVSSVAGYRGLPSASAYGATKAALINMAEGLQPDLAQHGIKLSLINPGFVRTPLTDLNEFPMPFLMEVEPAAARVVSGLARGGFEITFPRRFTFILKLLRILPISWYLALTKRFAMR
jgi:NAD(P)-dependent dehydrogenase (short-subunit alcohol dehydrogenase family)